MNPPLVDGPHHLTLVGDEHIEKLARLKDYVIPKYISWAQRIQDYTATVERLRQRMKSGETHIDENPITDYIRKLEWAIPLLEKAWKRNLDMSIAESGKGRTEITQAIIHETGRNPPAEMNGHSPNPVTVIQNGNGTKTSLPPKKRNWLSVGLKALDGGVK